MFGMTDSSDKTTLLQRVDRFYEKHSASRVAVAALLVGISAFGAALICYYFTYNFFISLGSFAIVAIIVINFALYLVVPPIRALNESKSLIIAALNDPGRIQTVNSRKVVLADDSGNLKMLSHVEQKVWTTIVVPYFMQHTTNVRAPKSGKSTGRSLTVSEQKQLKSQKAEILEMEHHMKEEKARIEAERAKVMQERTRIDADKREIESRNEELLMAENMVIDRLNEVDRSQAELEQLREDVERSMATSKNSSSVDLEAAAQKEAALKAKEQELELLKQQLEEDQQIVASQKTELNQLKGEIIAEGETKLKLKLKGEPDSPPQNDLLTREQQLEARALELEKAARELEERTRYVSEVEDSLVNRLNDMSEREAFIEQGEEDIKQGRLRA